MLLNAICSPECTANALAIVRESAEEAGRDWPEFKVAQLIDCSVEDEHDTAIQAIKWEVARKVAPIQLPFIAGKRMKVGNPYIRREDIAIFEEAWNRGGKEALIEAVPDSYVGGMTASGTPDEVVARVQKFRDVGVQLSIPRPAAAHQTKRLLDLFAPTTAHRADASLRAGTRLREAGERRHRRRRGRRDSGVLCVAGKSTPRVADPAHR